jgi:hypothetical protein
MRSARAGRGTVVVAALLVVIAAGSLASSLSAQGGLIVTVTAPTAGSTVTGTVIVRADASPTAVAVQFTLDGANLGAEDTSSPYSVVWNSKTAPNGTHTLRAVARDVLGLKWTSEPVTVTVFNDLAAPTVAITAPAAGAVVSGVVSLAADASDNVGVAGVQFRLDGVALGAEDTSAPYSVNWTTTTASNGLRTLTAVARDAAGNSTISSAVAVTVDNLAPTVTVTTAAGQPDPAGTPPINFEVVFSEPVTGFTAADVVIEGTATGSKTAAVSGGPASYSVAVTGMTTDGTVSVRILAGAAVDAAGNASQASAFTARVQWDSVAPAVTVNQAQSQADPTDDVRIDFTVVFSEEVTGFAANDVAIDGTAGGVKTAEVSEGAFAPDMGHVFNVAITGTTTNGTVLVTIPAGGVLDAAGKANTASTSTDNTVTFAGADTMPPTVTMTAPASGATVAGTVTVSADASDNVAVAGVQFFVDGSPLGAEDTAAPYSAAWNTTTVANGSHPLTARARDAAGNSTTSAVITVTVANGVGTTTRIEDGNTAIAYDGAWNLGNTGRPWSGGTAAIGYGVGQDAFVDFRGKGITWIGFKGPWTGIANVYMDGTFVATVDLYAPTESVQASVFTATGLPLGPHTLRIEVTRTKNAASSDFVVVVDAFDIIDAPPDANAPTVTITSPIAGTTVFGTVPVTASASDDTGVASVLFFLDGAPLGPVDTISPYSVNWNTTTVTDGPHTLTATARDAAGNATTSAPVSVTVGNAAPPALAGATRIENTSLGITYVDGCPTCGQSPTWFHGSRSRAWSDGTASFNRSDGARATLAFNGTAVKWIGFRAAWAGIARVFIDGAFVAEVDLYSPTEQVQAPVYQIADLAPGNHTIAVESTGRRNPDAQDYAVVVDAFDVSPGLPPPVTGTRYEDNSSSATFTPGWTQGDTSQTWSGGTAAVSSGVGESATFSFAGTAVHWIGKRGTDMGIARVYLDGVFQAQVDTYFTSTIKGVVYSVTGLAPGTHRLEIEVTGLRNAQASGHAIAVDAFDVRSRLEEDDVAVAYTGAWLFNDTARNWSDTSLVTGSGTASRSDTAGARAEVTFSGTAISWISVRAPWVGIADVYLDGVFAQQVDLYSATEQVQIPVFTASGLAPGTHTLRIEVTGTKNPAASTARVMIDAFDVGFVPAPAVARVQETNAAVGYSAGWTTAGVSTLWSGESAKEGAIVGAQATFTFTGTAVRWIGERGFATGVARVSLDGQFIALVDTRTPFQEEYQEPLVTRTGLAPGSHTLTIELVGRNSEAPGTTVDRIVIDAFDVQ